MKKIFLVFSMMLLITKISASGTNQVVKVVNPQNQHIGYFDPISNTFIDRQSHMKGLVYPNDSYVVLNGQEYLGILYKTPPWALEQFYILDPIDYSKTPYTGPVLTEEMHLAQFASQTQPKPKPQSKLSVSTPQSTQDQPRNPHGDSFRPGLSNVLDNSFYQRR